MQTTLTTVIGQSAGKEACAGGATSTPSSNHMHTPQQR